MHRKNQMVVLILVLLITALASAEVDSSATLPATLRATRAEAWRSLSHGQIVAQKPLVDTIASRFPGERFVLFFALERQSLAFLAGEWDWLLDTANWELELGRADLGKVIPPEDHVSDSIRKHFLARGRFVEGLIGSAPVTQADKEFLLLMQQDLRARLGAPRFYREGLVIANSWLEQYPSHPAAPFVRNRFVVLLQPVGYSRGGWIGYPMMVQQGVAANALGTRAWGGVAVGGEIFTNGILLDLQGSFYFSEIQGSGFLVKGHPWNPGHDVSQLVIALRAGVPIFVGRLHSWIPGAHVGIRVADNLYYSQQSENKNEDWMQSNAWLYGLDLESRFTFGYGMNGAFFALAAGYDHMATTRGQPILLSDAVRVEIRIGGLFGQMKRVHK